MTGIVGVGIDVVDIARMRTVLARTPRFVERAFTAAEREYCEAKRDPTERYAARFAAKEAVLKVLDESILRIGLRQIEVIRAESGKPSILLVGAAAAKADELGVGTWHLSLTHTSLVAEAIAIGVSG